MYPIPQYRKLSGATAKKKLEPIVILKHFVNKDFWAQLLRYGCLGFAKRVITVINPANGSNIPFE